MPPTDRRLNVCLIGIILGLLLVGFVSGTPLRHVVQVLPACIVLVALRRGASWGPYAAYAIFSFWLLIMTLIWLHLLGLVHLITGNLSTIEIILTIFIAGWCLLGIIRVSFAGKPAIRILGFLSFALLQIAALWLSMQPYLSHR
ncbi:MAG TPA: hypothetical protein VGH37_06960 [Candidatus Acidoferrum sp.]|jgi:hypothetical protein